MRRYGAKRLAPERVAAEMDFRVRAAGPRHGRRDSNSSEILDHYRALGCIAIDTADLGCGFPDAVIGLVGVTELVEIKGEDGSLTPAQENFMAKWRGKKPRIVRNVADVEEHVNEVRRNAR